MQSPARDAEHLAEIQQLGLGAPSFEIERALKIFSPSRGEVGVRTGARPELKIGRAVIDDGADTLLRWEIEDRRSKKRKVHVAGYLAHARCASNTSRRFRSSRASAGWRGPFDDVGKSRRHE